jgi:hypothetical protein
MPTLLSAEPLTEEQIKEIYRKWREQQAQHDPEMRAFVRRPPRPQSSAASRLTAGAWGPITQPSAPMPYLLVNPWSRFVELIA